MAKPKLSFLIRLHCAILIIVVASLGGCAGIGPATREQLVDNLLPMVEIEERAARAMRNFQNLAFVGWLQEDDLKKLKEHYDVYYVYHKAAAIYLAQGDIKAYKSYVKLADEELKLMELTLAAFTSMNPNPKLAPLEGILQ